MILSRRVVFCGEQLDEIHEAIVIRAADPGMPEEDVQETDRMGPWGRRITGRHYTALEATVAFAIDVYKKNLPLRREIYDAVAAWARRTGWLQYSSIPGRRLWVDKVTLRSPGDMWNWTADHMISFRALAVPFWESETPVTAGSANITSGTVPIDVEGTAPGTLDIEFRNISGMTIADVEVSAGGNTLVMKGVNLAASETLRITHPHENGGLLRIYAGGRDVYALRTGSDDLTVNPGRVNVGVKASRAGALTVTSYGRWL